MLRNWYTSATACRRRLMVLCFAALAAIGGLLPDRSLPSFTLSQTVRAYGKPEIKSDTTRTQDIAEAVAGRSSMLPLSSFASDYLTKPAASKDSLWQRIDDRVEIGSYINDETAPKAYSRVSLDRAAQAALLRKAPMEFSKAAKDVRVVITLPMPDGTFTRFRVEESPVMDSRLAARFPQIKTYMGRGIDDPTATARFDSTPAGFHAIVLSAHGTTFITPSSQGNPNVYLSYDARSMQEGDGSLVCSVPEAGQAAMTTLDKRLLLADKAGSADSIGGTLRTYRLAVAATAEYTQTYGGGTVDGALAAVTTTVNLVNAIYERDVAIRLMLIANETAVIFTNTATDGYTSDVIDTMYNQNQGILDSRIGAINYDIGHVFDGHTGVSSGHFFFQGRGEVASVCVNGLKGKGASIFRSLQPSEVNAVYTVAHEMGHQFGATHTFNGTTNPDCLNSRTAFSAFEPGTGSTIMAYRGHNSDPHGGYFTICGAEDLRSTDLYFHIASISQIINYTTTGNGASCAGLIATGNNAPMVDAGADYTIPRSTPFTLTATGSDPDADALTYCWEELDLGAPSPPSTDDGARPIFRSFAPTPSPSRIFPQLSDILNGASTFGESLPVTTRAMNFRVTLRDNHPGGGGGSTDAMIVNVTAGSGPFVVNGPASSTNWTGSSTQTVTWDVANTSNAPVNCASVRILLSVDGGLSFPFVLNPGTPNNGAATVTVPNTPTAAARVKVEAVGNIFFDISDANFSITAGATPTPTPTAMMQLSAANFSINENDASGFVNIVVTRSGDTSSAASSDYATSDTSGLIPCQTNGNGLASDRCDYASALGTLRFAPGEQNKTIQIPIINDAYVEPNETFTISLRNPQGASLGTSTATVTIIDDDKQTATTNPIDDQAFFIREQYVDFLGRVAEPAGFTFWMNRMNNCPAGDTCDRIDTSKRFFESDEFQERGFYVYRLYDAALGRLPGYVEFVPDVARLNGPQTPAEQRQGKDAYLLDFMNKAEFRSLYGQYLNANGTAIKDAASAAGFVNALCATAGLTPASKQTLITNLQNGTRDPAHTLEEFILTPEISEVGTKFYDRARIVMQYFGYLRRDPEAGGFDFWWDRLTKPEFGHFHDYRWMVGGFLNSDEYRFRFALLSAP